MAAGTLVITKAYASGAILLEAHIDNFRNGLLTFFNTDGFTSAQFASLALTDSYFTNLKLTVTDSAKLVFGTGSDGEMGVNSSKELFFNTTVGGRTFTLTCVTKTVVCKTTQIDLPGEVIIGAGQSGYGILHQIGYYRKPVLVYQSSTSIAIENNSATSNETIISFPSRILAVTEALAGSEKYRKMSIGSTANGYDAAHTGAALGGLRSGLTLTANTWYAIYACRVRGGTNAGNKFILVGDSILPTQTNYATLNSRYGDGEWVYLGLVRYGYGVVGSTTSIVPFVYTNKGWCYFTLSDAGVTTAGVTLAQSTTNADDAPFYTVADGMSGATIPLDTIDRAQWNMDRQSTSDWKIRDASDVVVWRGGWPDPDLGADEVHGHLVITGVQSGMDFAQTRITTGAVDKRVSISAFSDRLLNCRRHGHGV